MKKSIHLLSFLLICLTTTAQTIVSDEVTSDGVRHIHGSLEIARDFKDREVFSIGLGAIQTPDSVVDFLLSVKVIEMGPYHIKKGNVLLLKTFEGEVVTLSAMDDFDASVRDVHNVNGYVYSDYSTIAIYPITKQQILSLIKGVSKIRQETFTGTHNKEFKKDKMGDILKEEYILINKSLRTSKNIYDGF